MKFNSMNFENSILSIEGVSKTVQDNLLILADQQSRLTAYQRFMNDARLEYESKVEKLLTVLSSLGLGVQTWSNDYLTCLSGIYFGRNSFDKGEVKDASVWLNLRLESNRPRKNKNAILAFIKKVEDKVFAETGWLIMMNQFSFIDRDEAKTTNLLTELRVYTSPLRKYGINNFFEEVKNEN